MTDQERNDILAMFRQTRYNADKARQMMNRPDLTPVQARVIIGRVESIFRDIATASPNIGDKQALEQAIRCVTATLPRKIANAALKS